MARLLKQYYQFSHIKVSKIYQNINKNYNYLVLVISIRYFMIIMIWSLRMIKNKTFKVLVVSTLILPLALTAEESFFKDKLPSIVKNIANGFENGEGKEAI